MAAHGRGGVIRPAVARLSRGGGTLGEKFPGVWARPGAWPCRAQTFWGEEGLALCYSDWPPYLTPA